MIFFTTTEVPSHHPIKSSILKMGQGGKLVKSREVIDTVGVKDYGWLNFLEREN